MEDEAALSGGLMNEIEAKMKLADLLGEETVAALADAQWKVSRLLAWPDARICVLWPLFCLHICWD